MLPQRERYVRRPQPSAQSSYNTMDTTGSTSTAAPPIAPILANSRDSANGMLLESDPDIDPKSAHQRLSSTPVDATRAGYDDYGAELDKDARVWSAYVKEAEQWDDEMVDGWNRSLDVILVFAALFSAVSTTFLVESSKKLQPDSGDVSAAALLEITQVLRSMANNQSAPPQSTNPSEFTPPLADIWINVLWFLSLALSVSVSLVAMLAKQWCYSFMSGRAGQPHIQARTRQRRLEELERWKMPEILAFLPSLMHLSLFLFFVGLIINLWNTHIGVAAPVLATTIFTVSFYAATTVLPITYELCPYGTPLSQFLKAAPSNFDALKRIISAVLRRVTKVLSRPDLAARAVQGLFTNTPRGAGGAEREKKVDEPVDPESLMDNLTSRALGWLITNSQDMRSIDIALQAIAGADRRLPIKPLLDNGAHHLVTQRFRNCFLSHPQSGFSYLCNPSLLDAASLYGRGLGFFMSNPQCIARIENVIRKGPGGGFAIRRAYQWQVLVFYSPIWIYTLTTFSSLQHDYARSRPNIATFGLVGLSTWWEMRLHTGQPAPGILPDALSMIKRHAQGEAVLHPRALVALIDTIAEEAQHWMRRLAPRERAQYPVHLLRLLDQMDQLSFSHARPAIAVCFTSLAFVFNEHDTIDDTLQSAGIQSPGHKLLRYYASNSSRNRDAEPLLVYGLLCLLRDRHAYELSDTEISAVAQQLAAVYEIKPPPSERRLPFISPPTDLGTLAIETILPALSPVATDPVSGKEARGRILQAFLPYSYMWGAKSAEIYSMLAESLRPPHSDALQQIWKRWLGSQWTTYYASDMLSLLERHQTFPHLLHLISTDTLEYAAVPFAMAHCWSMANHIVKWNRRWGNQAGYSSFGTLLGAIISQISTFITECEPTAPSRGVPLSSLLTRMAEAWLPQLEILASRVPADVLNSEILTLLSESYTSNKLAEIVDRLQDECSSQITIQEQ